MERKSKSQVKREMSALQSLGERLVGLGPDQIRRIEMPEDLREAILFAAKLKKGEALRRQLQFIGTLMRDLDPEPIRKALDDIAHGRGMDARLLRKIEGWRDALLAGDDDLLNEILRLFPQADSKWLRRCVLNGRREQAAQEPPRSSRALFRYLRDLSEA
ncbi:MAG: DUF615 domain-containing protein [Syntrophobacteraceae bacterium]|jgi:ribosome-associated protein|nr:DUF615 domain-containing protein [Syntrophobacteraceae bacterium]